MVKAERKKASQSLCAVCRENRSVQYAERCEGMDAREGIREYLYVLKQGM
ncbi:unnamed protein product [Lathyrus oleraceus]